MEQAIARRFWERTMLIAKGDLKDQPEVTMEVIYDPALVAVNRARQERARRNNAWLQSHWNDLLPQAFGKFLAVAGQQGHIADTPEAAWAWADATHPNDDTATVQYVRPPGGPRIYAYQG